LYDSVHVKVNIWAHLHVLFGHTVGVLPCEEYQLVAEDELGYLGHNQKHGKQSWAGAGEDGAPWFQRRT